MNIVCAIVNRSLYTLGENSEIEFWKKIPEFGKYELPVQKGTVDMSPSVQRQRFEHIISKWLQEMVKVQIKFKQRIGYEVLDIKPGSLMNLAVLQL